MTRAALDYWPCWVLDREGFTYGPSLAQFLNQSWSGYQVINQSWSGYLASFIARARFRIRCVLGESKSQPTLTPDLSCYFLHLSSYASSPPSPLVQTHSWSDWSKIWHKGMLPTMLIYTLLWSLLFMKWYFLPRVPRKEKGWDDQKHRCQETIPERDVARIETQMIKIHMWWWVVTQQSSINSKSQDRRTYDKSYYTGQDHCGRREGGREWLVHHSMLRWPSVQWDVQGGYSHKLKEELLLEWVAMPSSSRLPWPRDQTHVSCVSCISSQVLYR